MAQSLGARALLGAVALGSLCGLQRQPGELLALPAAAVVRDLQAPPLVAHAAPPADSTRAERAAARLAALRERVRNGEQVVVKLTAYCLKGRTRRGNRVRDGIAAADPRVFPLGRHVEVFVGTRRLGTYLIDDTGGAVRGPHLDLWIASCAKARRFGRRRGKATLLAVEEQQSALKGRQPVTGNR